MTPLAEITKIFALYLEVITIVKLMGLAYVDWNSFQGFNSRSIAILSKEQLACQMFFVFTLE